MTWTVDPGGLGRGGGGGGEGRQYLEVDIDLRLARVGGRALTLVRGACALFHGLAALVVPVLSLKHKTTLRGQRLQVKGKRSNDKGQVDKVKG